MFSNPGPQTKIGWAMGILLIPRFWSGSTRNSVSFFVLVRETFLYHLKACLYGFILNQDSKFLGGPFMVKNWFLVNFKSFFGFKAILGHEGGTQKFRVTAQNKAIQISFQMI